MSKDALVKQHDIKYQPNWYKNSGREHYSCLSTAWYSHALRHYNADATMAEKNMLYRALLKTYEFLESYARRERVSLDVSSHDTFKMVQGVLDKTLYNQDDVKTAITKAFKKVRDGQSIEPDGRVFGPALEKLPPPKPASVQVDLDL